MRVKVVTITGNMGSGKDSIAQELAANHGFKKVALATPLYSMAKQTYQGSWGNKVAVYDLYSTLIDVFGGPTQAPPFRAVSSLVLESFPKMAEDTDLGKHMSLDKKPREFLQKCGDLVRSWDEDLLVEYLFRRIISSLKDVISDHRDHVESVMGDEAYLTMDDKGKTKKSENLPPDPQPRYVITDVRMANEYKVIKEKVQNVLPYIFRGVGVDLISLKLDVDTGTAAQRVATRDGLLIEDVLATMQHKTESELDSIQGLTSIDATQDLDKVVSEALDIIEGNKDERLADFMVDKPSTEQVHTTASGIVDLAQYKKEREDSDE